MRFILKSFLTAKERTIGGSSRFPLEARIFHFVCLVTFSCLAFTIPFDFVLGISVLSLITTIASALVALAYYYSRIRKMTNRGIILFNIVCYLFLISNFYLNSGLNGPTLLIFVLFFVMSIAIAPPGQKRIWFPLNVAVVSFLIISQWISPQVIADTYAIQSGRSLDMLVSYVVVAFMIFVVISQIMKSYLEQRNIEMRLRKDAENAHREAERVNEAKSLFLATMSHEIRTPLNGVTGMVALLSDTSLNPEQEDLVKMIRDSSKSLMSILNDILDFSKIESGNMEIERSLFNIHKCLDDLRSMLAFRAREKGLELKCIIDESVPVYIIGDSTRLTQVLLNLISNAIKFTHVGEITVSAGCRIVDGDDIELSFEVNDTGIGIPHNKIPLLFNSFTQVDSSTTRKYGGTGLGLAISQKLTRMMGGYISVKSKLGKGSQFSFTILCQKQSPFRPRGGASLQEPGLIHPSFDRDFARTYPLSILLAEDNLINQKLLVMTLSKLGYSTDVAVDGAEAVEMFSRKKYDLVFMDVLMPELDGIEATRQIRLLSSENTYIVGLTANALQSDRDDCLSAGMNDYLTKPFRMEDLVPAIKSAWHFSIFAPEEIESSDPTSLEG